MKAVEIRTLCDVCLGDTAGDARIDAIVSLIFSPPDNPEIKREIDLCATHLGENSLETMHEDSRIWAPEEPDKPPSKRTRR